MATRTMRPRTSILAKYWNFTGAVLVMLLGSAVIALPQCRGEWHILIAVVAYLTLGTAVGPYVWETYRTAVEISRQEKRRLRIFAGTCPECGYSLYASSDRCPECGTPISEDALANLLSFDRLKFRPDVSDSVKAAVATAKAEAARMFHDHLGTEHLLIGLLQVAEREEVQLNLSPDVNSRTISQSVESVVGIGDSEDLRDPPPGTPAAYRVLSRAREFHRHEGTQAVLLSHLLEALRAETGSVAAEMLANMDAAEQPAATPPA